jgi:ATP-citrate lyase alpha-subunit
MFTTQTTAIFYNTNLNVIQRMCDYEYLIARDKPSIVATIHPTNTKKFVIAYFGDKPIVIPQFRTIEECYSELGKQDILINFASYRSSGKVTIDALQYFKAIYIVAEGIEERTIRNILKLKKPDQLIIGPSSVGAITAGKFKIGNIGGSIENLIESNLINAGSVGLITKSGGLFNELAMMISKYSNGIRSGVAIGGESIVLTTFVDVLILNELDDNVKFNVIIGEVGGRLEIEVANAVKLGLIKKPIIGWCIGTCSESMKDTIQFGHGGSFANSEEETAVYKNNYMRSSGILVPIDFNGLGLMIAELSKIMELKKEKTIEEAIKSKLTIIKNRKSHDFICTISNDTGPEILYNNHTLDSFRASNKPLISVITNLWFKKDFTPWANEFLELVMIVLADHGPAVSGAHNARVTARAGKDVVDSLVSGLLTIGPRFGGALDEAGLGFYNSYKALVSPQQFVDNYKQQGRNIPGIGHLVKSKSNPDKRVTMLVNYAKANFKTLNHLYYAQAIETICLTKKENLILNVDGAIAALLLDMLINLGYSEKDIKQILDIGVFNSFFILSRTIGFIGHALDEKRLETGLYRHNTSNILYI